MAMRPLRVVADIDETPAIRGLDKLEDGFDDLADEAERSSDRIARSYKEGFEEAGKEAGQSGREAAASFSGGFDDVADFVQETLANALGGFGPVGAAAGIALAAGIGAALQGLADQQERLEEMREAAKDLASTLYENRGELPMEEQVDRLFDILLTERKPLNALEGLVDQWADFGTVLQDVRTTAKNTNIPLSRLMRAIGGADGNAARSLLRDINEELARMDQAKLSEVNEEWQRNKDALNATKRELENVIVVADATGDAMAAVGSTFDHEALEEKVRAIGQAWQDNAVDAADYITETEDGLKEFDWEAYVREGEQAISDARELQKKMLTVPSAVRLEAQRIYETQGAGSALAFISAYEKANPEVKRRMQTLARANGTALGNSLADAAYTSAQGKAQGLGSIPIGVTPSVGPIDKSKVESALSGVSIPVQVKPYIRTRAGVRTYIV